MIKINFRCPRISSETNFVFSGDYWALGAIVFQMISGQPPFRALNEYQILKKILGLDFQYPDGFPEIARDLVTKLLVYRPAERLGSKETGGIEAVKSHGYFQVSGL
jgi:3-phosphoinositide dependent protein kinase-1